MNKIKSPILEEFKCVLVWTGGYSPLGQFNDDTHSLY